MHLYHCRAVFQLFGLERLRTIGKVVTVKPVDKFLNIDSDDDDPEHDHATALEKDAEEQRQSSAGWMKTMVTETMKGKLVTLDSLTPDQRAHQASN